MKRGIVRTLKIVLPLAVIGAASFAALVMWWSRSPVEFQPPVFTPPGVRVAEVTLRDVPLSVTSQGTVRPRTESQLVTEITGRVTWVAPSFAEGGFFELGDVLVKIDPFDYQQAVVGARSQLAQARLRLAQEEAEAEVAVREWDALGRGDPRALTLREPQLEEARASVAGAEAGLERAQRDLERAEIVAPYVGRIREKNVDIGQFVRVGDVVASIYAVDFAEVRLPLPDDQLAYLDLPLSYRGGSDQPQPRVTLRATFAGEAHEWQGRIVRTESEIDPVSRMVHAVAEVPDPYGPGPNQRRPPLAVGMYVEAEIAGRTARNVAVLPRAALRGRDRVLVVDADDRLSFREVSILRATTDAIYVQRGLADGDLVVVSPLETPTEGMRVQLADADADLLARRRGTAPATLTTADAAPVTDRATAPGGADVDIDPSLSRDEQIAAIRRQLAVLRGTAAAPPDVSPDRRAAPPPRVAD
ncbi:MAG: efflux RND transporter periplasmic adaptor subunit, partial [Acidobacteria bacterium]|nr:efflux RND transporter periplasmic adaptor subunit [Acidobacteriota bacterium]